MNGEHKETGAVFRFVIGALTMLTAIGGFGALFFIAIPRGNENAIMFALGAVFGWAGSVVASEYGATTTGRKIAEGAVRSMERQNLVNESSPSGTPDDPIAVEGAATGAKPVATKDAKP